MGSEFFFQKDPCSSIIISAKNKVHKAHNRQSNHKFNKNRSSSNLGTKSSKKSYGNKNRRKVNQILGSGLETSSHLVKSLGMFTKSIIKNVANVIPRTPIKKQDIFGEWKLYLDLELGKADSGSLGYPVLVKFLSKNRASILCDDSKSNSNYTFVFRKWPKLSSVEFSMSVPSDAQGWLQMNKLPTGNPWIEELSPNRKTRSFDTFMLRASLKRSLVNPEVIILKGTVYKKSQGLM